MTSEVIARILPVVKAGVMTQRMKAYAIAYLRNVRMGADIVEYLERIDETLAPYDGHFLVHGATAEQIEGEWEGAPIVIEFPDYEHLRDWYESPDYREILPLRTGNSDGVVIFVEGVDRKHKATDVLV
jgi:uncharacterized protein (DUF1330 family)